MVQKTSQRQLERQQAAREEFVRRAQMSNIAFGQTSASFEPSGLLVAPDGSEGAAPTEGQILRNQAFAGELGIAPATLRHNFKSGWRRPTDPTDEFGKELTAAIYPDSLILEARERMTLVAKVEKKWKNFLEDDAAASLPLNPMNRPARAFVHQYSDFWNLNTESFDPEPRRYIHCVKLRGTRAPHPLLSDAARNWHRPHQAVRTVNRARAEGGQAAGEPPREDGLLSKSVRLALPPGMQAPPGAIFGLEQNTETEDQVRQNRSTERPVLKLAPRTEPLDLPPMALTGTYNVAEDRDRAAALRTEQEQMARQKEEQQRKVLESAFASDSDESSDWEEDEVAGQFDDENILET